MNFLQLCKSARQLAGIQGDGPSTVTGQTGLYAVVVDAVAEACDLIQADTHDLGFQWSHGEFTATVGVGDYTAQAISIPYARIDIESVIARKASGTKADEYRIIYLEYWQWTQCYGVGITENAAPVYVTVTPKRVIRLTPCPDVPYTIGMDYYSSPVTLANNIDVPSMPTEYHPAIVWLAVSKIAAFKGAFDIAQAAVQRYGDYHERMLIHDLVVKETVVRAI